MPLSSAVGLTSASPAEMFREHPTNDFILLDRTETFTVISQWTSKFYKNGEKNSRGRRESDNTFKKR